MARRARAGRDRARRAAVGTAIGGGLIALSSLLPWFHLAAGRHRETLLGIASGYGFEIAAAGAFALVAAWLAHRKPERMWRIAAAMLGALALALTLTTWLAPARFVAETMENGRMIGLLGSRTAARIRAMSDSGILRVEVAYGLRVAAAGAALALGAALAPSAERPLFARPRAAHWPAHARHRAA